MYQKELEYIRRVIREAGEILCSVYREGEFEICYKADQSPLTKADQASNDFLVRRLREAFPYGIVSEESEDDPGRYQSDLVWIIDPLDGTKEFIRRKDEFCISIGLVKEGRPVLGAIHDPLTEDLYYAIKGEGAWRERSGQLERLSVSKRRERLRLVRSRSRDSGVFARIFQNERVDQMQKMGSALKGCLIAAGEADLCYSLGYTMEWDTCAMDLLVEEAGGIFRQLDGRQMEYNRKDHLNRGGYYMINHPDNQLLEEVS